jgi:hypothetical protein
LTYDGIGILCREADTIPGMGKVSHVTTPVEAPPMVAKSFGVGPNIIGAPHRWTTSMLSSEIALVSWWTFLETL